MDTTPHGFTWAHVDLLRRSFAQHPESMESDREGTEELDRLADLIAALLPPRD